MAVDIKPYHDYMEAKAVQILGHNAQVEEKTRFLMMGIEEIVNATSLSVPVRDVHIMVLEAVEIGTPIRGESKNPMLHGGAYSIISHADVGDYAMQKTVCERAFQLGWEVVLKMQEDYASRYKQMGPPVEGAPVPYFDDFDNGTIRAFKVGPLFGTMHGYRFEFDGSRMIKDLSTTPEIWQE